MARKKLVTILREAMAESVRVNPDMKEAVSLHAEIWSGRFGNPDQIRGEGGIGPAPALDPLTAPPMLIDTFNDEDKLKDSIQTEVFEPKIVDGKWQMKATSFTTNWKFPLHEYSLADPAGNKVKARTTLAPTRMEYSETVNAAIAAGFMGDFARRFKDKATKG